MSPCAFPTTITITPRATYLDVNPFQSRFYGVCNITDGRFRQSVKVSRAGRMTCKVRRDFKTITDVLSRVSLVTSNIWGSSICSPKSP